MKLSRFLATIDFDFSVTLIEVPFTFGFGGFGGVGLYTVLFEATNCLVSSSSSEASITIVFLSSAFSFEPIDRSLDEASD